jgi:hypothetical protein
MILLTKPELRHELVSTRNKLKQSEANNLKLLIAVAETANELTEVAQELHCMIDMKNAELESGINSADLQSPDYFDHQTVHDAMVSCKHLRQLVGECQ